MSEYNQQSEVDFLVLKEKYTVKKNIQNISLFLLAGLVSTSYLCGFNSASYRKKYRAYTAEGVKEGEKRAHWENYRNNWLREDEAAKKEKRLPSWARLAALNEESEEKVVKGRADREGRVQSGLSEYELGVKFASGKNCKSEERFAVDLEHGSMDKIGPLHLLRACVKCQSTAMYKALAEKAEADGHAVTIQDVHGALMYEPLQVLPSSEEGGERADVKHSQVPLEETKHVDSAVNMNFIRDNNPELWKEYMASSLPQEFIDERMTNEDSMTTANMEVVKAVYEGNANLDRVSLEKLKRYAEYNLNEETRNSWWASEEKSKELSDFLKVIKVKVDEMGADEEKKRKADYWPADSVDLSEEGAGKMAAKKRTRPKVDGEEAK